MSPNKPRHPVVIIGAGIAGLSAAAHLADAGIPYRVLERFNKAGGRLNSREGDGWVADHGTQYFLRSDERISQLIRRVGFEERRTVIQGGVHRLEADGTITVPPNGGIDSNRMCVDLGLSHLANGLAAQLTVDFGRAVGAIRWDNNDKTFWWEEGQVFWFEDENGDPIRDHVSRKVLVASGVILATTPTVAQKIARRSPSLAPLVEPLSTVQYTSCYTAIYRIANHKTRFWALDGANHPRLRWVAFEDRKAPERIRYEYSLLVVQASPSWSPRLMSMPDDEAMAALYNEVRAVVPDLPERPISQTFKKWNVAQLESAPLGLPAPHHGESPRWPVNPEWAPFALAGDYVLGPRAEDAAQAGLAAARMVVSQLPRRRTFLGLELKA